MRRPSLHGRTCSAPATGPTPPSHRMPQLLLLLRLPASGRHYRFGGCRAPPCRQTSPLPATLPVHVQRLDDAQQDTHRDTHATAEQQIVHGQADSDADYGGDHHLGGGGDRFRRGGGHADSSGLSGSDGPGPGNNKAGLPRPRLALRTAGRQIDSAGPSIGGNGRASPPLSLLPPSLLDLFQPIGGGGSRPSMIASICGASMVSYCSSSCDIVCSLSMFSVSSSVVRAYALSRMLRTSSSMRRAVSLDTLLCWVTERPRNTSSSSSP